MINIRKPYKLEHVYPSLSSKEITHTYVFSYLWLFYFYPNTNLVLNFVLNWGRGRENTGISGFVLNVVLSSRCVHKEVNSKSCDILF